MNTLWSSGEKRPPDKQRKPPFEPPPENDEPAIRPPDRERKPPFKPPPEKRDPPIKPPK